MGASKSLTKDAVDNALIKLRLSSKVTKDKTFSEVVEEVWDELTLIDSPNPTLLENLLIKSIEDVYSEEYAACGFGKKYPQREAAINRDISLLMFGLLDNYYHTKIDKGVEKFVELSVRYKSYLSTNVYVNLEYAGKGTYKEIVARDKIERRGKQPLPLNRITHIAGDCRERLVSKLYDLIKSGDYQSCSKTADFDKLTGQRIDLPKPLFTEENYTPRTSDGRMVPIPVALTQQEELNKQPEITSQLSKLPGQELLANTSTFPESSSSDVMVKNDNVPEENDEIGDMQLKGGPDEGKSSRGGADIIAITQVSVVTLFVIAVVVLFAAIFTLLIANNFYGRTFQPTAQDYPEKVSSTVSNVELVPVEEIKPDEVPTIPLILGGNTKVPLTLLPEEADQNVGISCSDVYLLQARYEDGYIVLNTNNYDGPKFSTKVVVVTIVPETRISYGLSKELNVEVKYDPNYANKQPEDDGTKSIMLPEDDRIR